VMYRMFAGELPKYPFESPLPGATRIRRMLNPDFLALIRKAIDPNPAKRFRDAVAMHNALTQIRQPLKATATKTAASTTKRSSRRRTAA
jgi:eukaryotic-like serine/threonine-protein kinase